MQLVLINEENADYFGVFAPAEFASFLAREDMIAVGMIKTVSDEAVPIGLLVMSEEIPDAITIEWIFVAPNTRGRGVFRELLDYAFETALKYGYSRVLAKIRFSLKDGKNDEVRAVEDRLLEEGFLPVSLVSPVTLKDRFYSPNEISKRLKVAVDESSIKSIKNLPGAFESTVKESLANSLSSQELMYFDADSSTVCIDNNKITGILAVLKTGDTYIPVSLYTEDTDRTAESVKLALLATSIKNMAGVSGERAVMHLKFDEYSSIADIADLLKGADGIDTEYYEAASDEVERDIERNNHIDDQLEQAARDEADIPTDLNVANVEYFSGVYIDQ